MEEKNGPNLWNIKILQIFGIKKLDKYLEEKNWTNIWSQKMESLCGFTARVNSL